MAEKMTIADIETAMDEAAGRAAEVLPNGEIRVVAERASAIEAAADQMAQKVEELTLDRLRIIGILEEYDGDALRGDMYSQLGDANKALSDIRHAIDSGEGPDCAWTDETVDDHCGCPYHAKKRELRTAKAKQDARGESS